MKKRALAVIITITIISTLFTICSNALQLGLVKYPNTNNPLLSITYGNISQVKSFADMRIHSASALSTYNFGVITTSIKGYDITNNNVFWQTDYLQKKSQYSNKDFDDTKYTKISSVGIVTNYYENNDLLPVSVHALYIAGKSASHYSSSYNCSFLYYNPEYMVCETIYFSRVAYGDVNAAWVE